MNAKELGSAVGKVVTVGFDGYIDRICRVKHQSLENGARYFGSMESFGGYIAQKDGKSCSLELRLLREKAGGNMPNYAHCLAMLGARVNCVGALGYPEVEPIFRPLRERCSVYTVCKPGICTALEMGSSKLMLADNADIEQLDYQMLVSRLPESTLRELIADADLTVFLNWSELAGAASIWAGIAANVAPRVAKPIPAPLFIDISDCSHHSPETIAELIAQLRVFARYFDLRISLNENETEQLLQKLDIGAGDLETAARELQARTGCGLLVIHTLNGCLAFNGAETLFSENVFIENPKLLTGGGDNFNAGFSFAQLAGLPLRDALRVGNAVSGYYVYHGESPTLSQLNDWMEHHQYV